MVCAYICELILKLNDYEKDFIFVGYAADDVLCAR